MPKTTTTTITMRVQQVHSLWVVLWLLATATRTINAFQVLPPPAGRSIVTATFAGAGLECHPRVFTLRASASFEDSDAPSEEDVDDGCGDECEIDWDSMPSFEEEEEEEEMKAMTSEFDDDEEDDEDEDDELESVPTQGRPSVAQRRLHMEMQWQLMEASQECVVEEPETCGSEKCTDCNGRGWSNCRFCHGTAVLKIDMARPAEAPPTTMADVLAGPSPTATTSKRFLLPSSFSPCKICHQGVEMCKTCQGSGWIAGWTKIPNQRQDDPLMP